MEDVGQPPPGGGQSIQNQTTRNRSIINLSQSLCTQEIGRIKKSERLNRNVLQVTIEKERDSEGVTDVMISNLFNEIGIKKSDVEGVQMVPEKFPKCVYIWMHPTVNLNKYCRDDCFRLTEGVKTGTIKPMDRREAEVLIKGLNINTPDGSVIEYLSLFGKVVKHEVVYTKIKKGPLTGFKNGDRKFLMDFTGGRNLGTYHIIDGNNVRISYGGQRRTCGRCHNTASKCIGGGLAKVCEERGGNKINLRDHMKDLWNDIGFKPDTFTLDKEIENETMEDVPIKDKANFTPPHKNRSSLSNIQKSKFSGISVRNLPKDITEEEVVVFLESKGLPTNHEDISVNDTKFSTRVDVDNLESSVCCSIIENLKDTVYSQRKLYTRGLVVVDDNQENTNTNIDESAVMTTDNAPIESAVGTTDNSPIERSVVTTDNAPIESAVVTTDNAPEDRKRGSSKKKKKPVDLSSTNETETAHDDSITEVSIDSIQKKRLFRRESQKKRKEAAATKKKEIDTTITTDSTSDVENAKENETEPDPKVVNLNEGHCKEGNDKEVRKNCVVCNKILNVKSMAKHMRNIHPAAREVVSPSSVADKASARSRRQSWSFHQGSWTKQAGEKNAHGGKEDSPPSSL